MGSDNTDGVIEIQPDILETKAREIADQNAAIVGVYLTASAGRTVEQMELCSRTVDVTRSRMADAYKNISRTLLNILETAETADSMSTYTGDTAHG